MKKKILTVITSAAVIFCGCSGAAMNSEAIVKSDNVQAVSSVQNTKYTYAVKDVINLQDYLLGRETSEDLEDKPYDFDDDGVLNIFDLCMMKNKILYPDTESKDTIVVYFSRTNNTEKIADYIIDYTDADSYEIEAAVPYTDADIEYSNSSCRANKEQNDKSVRPEIAEPIDSLESYDVVYLGYPIWWGEEPRIIDTFLESYDFSDKIVIPFCTSASSGISASERNISKLVPIKNQLEGKRFAASASKESVCDWVDTKKSEISELKNTNPQYTLISGGTFTMGSPENEPERGLDEIQHKVTVNDFYISKMEVSQKEYEEITGTNPSEKKGENLPVTNITWYDAVNYCNLLSKKENLTPCYEVSGDNVIWNQNSDGYRLPTEAEWEFAARANTDTPFNFGDYVEDELANCYNAYGYNNDASGHWVNDYLQHTVDVDSYPASDFGLYNMHGNVGEWVWDWYSEYTDKDALNPVGSETGTFKVVRGGGWNDMPKHIRSAYRSVFPAEQPFYSIGLRPVRSAKTVNKTVESRYINPSEKKSGKVLIAYFSQTGNTDGLAKIIAEKTGADVFRIERATPYSATSNSTKLYGEALDELRNNDAPDLKTYLEDAGYNIDDYDTILLGYCNWWASVPAPITSFLRHYDMSGKTIAPFCSMGGGRFGQTISAIAKLAPNSVIEEGLDITYSSYDEKRIDKWIEDVLK